MSGYFENESCLGETAVDIMEERVRVNIFEGWYVDLIRKGRDSVCYPRAVHSKVLIKLHRKY